MMAAKRRRVVITGLGAISPLGLTFSDTWNALLQGQSGATTLSTALSWQGLPDDELAAEQAVARTLPCQVAAPVQWHEHDARTARFVQFALQAAADAVQQSKLEQYWRDNNNVLDQTGVSIGSGMSAVRDISRAAATLQDRGVRRLSPHFVPLVLANSAAGRVSLQYNVRGPNLAPATACAASAHAIGDAIRHIQYGHATIMLAGGAESCLDPLSMAGFCRLKALSTNYNDEPEAASRPFAGNRDGFVMAEGAAILVLEELQHAIARNATILAEVVGYGASGDAHHITSPDPEGWGARASMQAALAENGGNVDNMKVHYINAHATSTPLGDNVEARAIVAAKLSDVYVSSTKGATGHLLGAAGALEAAVTVQALVAQTIPPTRNLTADNNGCDMVGLQHVYDAPIACNLECAMSNSFGFGGTNASLIFRIYNA